MKLNFVCSISKKANDGEKHRAIALQHHESDNLADLGIYDIVQYMPSTKAATDTEKLWNESYRMTGQLLDFDEAEKEIRRRYENTCKER